MHRYLRYYLLLACLEGAAVMTVELSGAKLIAPFFGTSLYVWASVLAVTMSGLAAGYYSGGWLSQRRPGANVIFTVVMFSGIFTGIMPWSAEFIMEATLSMDVRAGALISSFVFLFPPVFLFGMLSPLLIRHCTQDAGYAGKAAGLVYAVSTVGGVAMTLLLGFYLMPEWGIRLPLWVVAGMLLLSAVLFFLIKGKKAKSVWILAAAGITSWAAWYDHIPLSMRFPAGSQMLYASEGILGELIVTDEPSGSGKLRRFYLNGLMQTEDNMTIQCSDHPYVSAVSRLAGMFPAGSRSLLLGMGGGTLLREMQRLGHHTDVCELDVRMPVVAQTFFGVSDEHTSVHTDDARHCLRTLSGKYDFAVLDVFFGDHHPVHVLTVEAAHELRTHLTDGGLAVILFPGPPESAHARGLVRTLREAGFQVALVEPDHYEDQAKLFVASFKKFTPQFFQPVSSTSCADQSGIPPFPPHIYMEADPDAVVFTDQHPVLETMLLSVRNLRAGNFRKK